MLIRPEPHPLDYDWRFTLETARSVARRIASTACVAVGTPTVAELLQGTTRVTLVDRHPIQGCNEHLPLDPSFDPPIARNYESAIVDPPWYPSVYMRWVSWAAHATGQGGVLWSSLWPSDTRPAAEEERSEILAWASTWASVTVFPGVLEYETPLFESSALRATGRGERPLRKGDLVGLHVNTIPQLPSQIQAHEFWARFVFGDYQLALRLRADDPTPPILEPHPLALGWTWPSVSRRANGRDDIDLWSSHNEVAIVRSVNAVRTLLQSLVSAKPSLRQEQGRSILGPLSEWHIPLSPSQRVLEWTHRS